MVLRSFKDRDYIETEEGWSFCVLGDIHPDDRVISYLKYVPGNGPWSRDGKRFERLMKSYRVEELFDTIEFLKLHKPEYTFFDWTVGEWMSCVPKNRIARHYCCRRRLQEIIKSECGDWLETKTKSLAESVIEASGVGSECMGVTGSLLLRIHHRESDIDLIVYGKDNFWSVLRSLESIPNVRPLGRYRVRGWMENMRMKYPMSKGSVEGLAKRLKNKMEDDGIPFSVHSVRLDHEVDRRYGDVVFSSLGIYRLRAVISDNSESCFMPSIYRLSDVVTGSELTSDVKYLCCYDGSLTTLLDVNDQVEVCGKVELVRDLRHGTSYKWIVIGTFRAMGKEYITLI